MKIPEVCGLRSFRVSELVYVLGGWHTAVPQGQRLPFSGPSQTSPLCLFFRLFICTSFHVLPYIINC